jgi:hypothetical protein
MEVLIGRNLKIVFRTAAGQILIGQKRDPHQKSKEPHPKNQSEKLPAFTNTWHCKDSGAGKDGNESGQSIAKSSKKQASKDDNLLVNSLTGKSVLL